MPMINLSLRNAAVLLRDPPTLALGLGMPLGLLALLVSLGAKAPLDLFKPPMLAPAIICFGFAFLVMFAALLVQRDRENGFFDRVRTTPLGAPGLVAAYLLPFLPLAAAQAFAAWLCAWALGMEPVAGMLLSLAVELPLASCCVGWGIVLGSFCNQNQIAAVGSVMISLIGLFSGAWFDLSLVGGMVQAFGEALPFHAAVQLSRSLVGSGLAPEAMAPLVVGLAAWTLLSLGGGVAVLWWRQRP